jgi:hypothetical protein
MTVVKLTPEESREIVEATVSALVQRFEALTREVFWPGIKADLLRRIDETLRAKQWEPEQ